MKNIKNIKIKNLFESKPLKWFFKHSLIVVPCILTAVLGTAFVVLSSTPVTTIGEDIRTRDITVDRNLIAKTGRTATIVVAAHNSSTSSRSQADFVADGVGDQVEIQAAINSLPTSGGKVLLMEGLYTVTDRITVNPNVTLEGVSWGSIIRLRDGVNPSVNATVLVMLSSNTILRGLTLDGNMMGQASTSRQYLATGTVWNSSNVTIEGNRFLNTYSQADIDFATYSSVINNHILWDVPTTTAAKGDAISINYSSYVTVMGNTINQERVHNAQGIDVQVSSFVTVKGNVIRGGFMGIEFHAPATYPSSRMQGNIAIGNTIDHPQLAGIRVRNNLDFVVANNTITNLAIAGICLSATPSFNGIIEANNISVLPTVWHGGVRGINLTVASQRIQILDNLLTTTAPVHIGQGIFIDASVVDARVEGNSLRGWPRPVAYINNSLTTIDSQQFSEFFMSVLSASPTHIQPWIAYTSTAITAVISPDVPRNVSASLHNSTAGGLTTVASTATITGIDARGRAITETISIPATTLAAGATTTIFGHIPFARVTQIQFSTVTQPAGIQLGVGISDRLGLSNPVFLAGDVFKVKRGTTDVAVGEVDVVNGTVNLAPITAGDNITIWYRSNLNIVR